MLFRNFTPFPPLQFESRDEKQNDFGVIVLRGTFQIRNGKRLRLVQEQSPLVMADEYFGEPGKSSLKYENNIAPYKPKTDVTLTGEAHSPNGKPATSWNVGLEFGDLQKTLTVTGPRHWSDPMSGRILSEIDPVTKVPLRYELAYGGQYTDSGGNLVSHETNPVGTGFVAPDSQDPVRAPQIFNSGEDLGAFGNAISVAGFAPVAPSWLPRRDKAGTFNVVWEKTRWPDLPEDFSFEFYNTASTGLTLPKFAAGDERVALINLTREGKLVFGLPKFKLATLLRFEDGRVIPGPIHLDTVHIDVPKNRVYLIWRGVFPVNIPMRVLEVRMKAPQDVIHQPDKTAATAQV